MVQHVLLIAVAAPLIVLAAPWMSIWRPLPLGFRRAVAGTVARSRWCAPVRALSVLGRPIPAFVAFTVDLVAWHLPSVYDYAAANRAVHDLEHLTFVALSMLLGRRFSIAAAAPAPAQHPPRLLHRRRLARRLGHLTRPDLLEHAAVPVYAHILNRPGGISALADQQLAGGIMLVPGSLAMTLYVFAQIYLWLGAEERDARARLPGG